MHAMSSLNYQRLASSQIPRGWSNESNRLSDVKTVFASADYGISEATPILAEKASPRFLFESKGRYYLWNAVSNAVVKIEEPVALEELLRCIAGAKWNKIKAVDVKRV